MSGKEDGEGPELDRLRDELLRRIKYHPVRCWTAPQLTAFIAVMDMMTDGPPPSEPKPPRLKLV